MRTKMANTRTSRRLITPYGSISSAGRIGYKMNTRAPSLSESVNSVYVKLSIYFSFGVSQQVKMQL